MSKGSRARPFTISQEELGNRITTIFGEKPKRPQWIPPPLPELIDKKESDIKWVSNQPNIENKE